VIKKISNGLKIMERQNNPLYKRSEVSRGFNASHAPCTDAKLKGTFKKISLLSIR
jgi:hypothetical protein